MNAITSAVRVEQIGNATLYLGDCREVLPHLLRPAAVIADPPYGIGYQHSGKGSGVRHGNGRVLRSFQRHARAVAGDQEPFDPALLLGIAPRVLLWGANHYCTRLPHGTWLVWDKVPTGKSRDQADGEIAWINDTQPRALRIFRHIWDGVCVADRTDLANGRLHPMQKPVALMRWCIQQARVPAGGVILDPYAGSGSTGVAALEMGHPFIGIEMEADYFETMCSRVRKAQMQPDMLAVLPHAEDPADTRIADLFREPEE